MVRIANIYTYAVSTAAVFHLDTILFQIAHYK